MRQWLGQPSVRERLRFLHEESKRTRISPGMVFTVELTEVSTVDIGVRVAGEKCQYTGIMCVVFPLINTKWEKEKRNIENKSLQVL